MCGAYVFFLTLYSFYAFCAFYALCSFYAFCARPMRCVRSMRFVRRDALLPDACETASISGGLLTKMV